MPVKTFRKPYELEEGKALVWGFDHISGYFLQVYLDDKEERMRLLDQGNKIAGFSIAFEYLTYKAMVTLLEEYCPAALKDFEEHVNQKLESPLRGYKFNIENKYRNYENLTTRKQLFQFFDDIPFNYIVTNVDDFQVFPVC